ncbi:uncharacterized protein LOC131954084 [Physella acuta]|uniref:uncharacterized protein LOC131954084 n=1 Tax=Physella acuta TaxID=109671 RepID=UPI0027DCA59C|nr:uncharacterized protein LOC131954084 [Physella acuta]
MSNSTIQWPIKQMIQNGNDRSNALRIIHLNFPTKSLRSSILLLLVLAALVIYHVLMHVFKLIMEVRRMALELSQPLSQSRSVKNLEAQHGTSSPEYSGEYKNSDQPSQTAIG